MDHPFKNLLLATECTEFDTGSERVALEMAKRCDLPLAVVVPVVSNPEFEVEAPRLIDRAEHEIASRIEALHARAKEMGVVIDVHARRGETPCKEIVSEACEMESDLIIIRRRGRRSFLANILVGEMVGKVVSMAPCSVLMVPRACNMWSRGVLVAVDASSDAGKVVAVAAAIASRCDLPLYVLSVAGSKTGRPDAGRIVERHVQAAMGLGASAKGLVLVGRACDEILAAPVDADLIVIGLGDVRSGGTTQKVVGQSEKPVLAVYL
ncbi:MAG: universal stress protein [Burkholderiales bacterium]|nr:universal stress protein [Burkholderiales bacterium]